MPTVGNRKFPYTKEGEQEAAAYAAETGQELLQENSFGYARGGMYPSEEDTAFKTAIQRELNPPKDQGHDRHLDNLKAIRAYALKNPEHFYQFMNMEEESGDLKRLKDNLTKEFAKYGSDDINNLMWGSDEWEMIPEGKQLGGPVRDQFGYGSYQEGGGVEHPRQNIEHIQAAINASYEEDDKGPAPIAEKRGEHFVVKLDIENALDQAGYLEDYVFAGSDNIPNMVYEVDGKLHKYDYSLFGGASLKPIEGMQAGGMYPSEEDMALAHKASRGETGLKGAFQTENTAQEALIETVFKKGETENTVGAFDGKGQRDHAALWGKFTDPESPLADKGFMAFMQADLDTKKDLLRMFGQADDDAIVASEEWKRISGQHEMQRGGHVGKFGY